MQSVTYTQLLVYLTEYNAFCAAWPFCHKLMPEKFRTFKSKNAAQINAMLERRSAVMDKYVAKSENGANYLTEQADETTMRFILLDESTREEFDAAFKEWENMVAKIDY